MILLILGLVLWYATHLFRILAPAPRAAAVERIGEGPWKAIIAVLSLVAVAEMVLGYRSADYIPVWSPPFWLWHVNNLLMLIAVFIFIGGSFASPVRRRIRHPQLTGVKTWAVAHLLVNGDLASIVLFGGMLGWAVIAVIGTNRRDGPRCDVPEAYATSTVIHVIVALLLFVTIAWLHSLTGYSPFPG